MIRIIRLLVPALLVLGIAQSALAADYRVGEKVDVQWKGDWYPAKVIEVKSGQWKIHYDGFSSAWDEWVKADRIRAAQGASPASRASWKVGDRVKVSWKGSWYPASILDVDDGKYRIHYDGYEDSWDEWVDALRIKGR